MNPFRRVGHDVIDTHPTASGATSPADPGATDAMRRAPAETPGVQKVLADENFSCDVHTA